MKRRGFLGFMGGAAVAGPGMAKQAIAGLADLSVGGGLGSQMVGTAAYGIGDSITYGSNGPIDYDPHQWLRDKVGKMVARTAAQHQFHMHRRSVHQLDPDIASYRSMALHQKIRLQRERDYWREIEGEKGYLEAVISGWLDA